MEQYVVVSLDNSLIDGPVDMVTVIYGPFATREEAATYASQHWACEVHKLQPVPEGR